MFRLRVVSDCSKVRRDWPSGHFLPFVAAAEPSGGHLVRTRGGEPRAPGIPPDHQDRAVRLLPRIPLRTLLTYCGFFDAVGRGSLGCPHPSPHALGSLTAAKCLFDDPCVKRESGPLCVRVCVICVSFSLTAGLTLLSGPKSALLNDCLGGGCGSTGWCSTESGPVGGRASPMATSSSA
jgi:hypothetical protein